jgi:predicted phage terminase large subunit-like protein
MPRRRLEDGNPLAKYNLFDFIPKVEPEYTAPVHLKEWIEQFELARQGHPVRALCALPIRHWKTRTTLLGIVWLLVQDPTRRYLLLTHSFERARTLGKQTRRYAEVARVGPTKGYNMIDNWSNLQGGGVLIMSAEQSRLGEDVHGVFFDDPLDEHGSMDPLRRDGVDETIAHYTARCQSHGKPGPVMGVMSRWHPDDPIGRRLLRTAATWTYIHKPAIVDEGLPTERAFAPHVWPLEALRQMRAELAEQDPTERIWHAQLQGDPRPSGSTLFHDNPARYDSLPNWNFRLAYGADLSYSAEEGSDYFALVALKVFGTKAYVLEVQRTKLDAHLIESTVKQFMGRYGFAPIFSYVSGPEVGMLRLMRERGLPFKALRARYNKLVRAERTIKRWNDGLIELPRSAPWVPGFLQRVNIFRGLDKARDDDEIDALVSVCDGALGGAAAGVVKTLGKSYGGLNNP